MKHLEGYIAVLGEARTVPTAKGDTKVCDVVVYDKQYIPAKRNDENKGNVSTAYTITFWGDQVDYIHKFSKGDWISVKGKNYIEEYTSKDGQQKWKMILLPIDRDVKLVRVDKSGFGDNGSTKKPAAKSNENFGQQAEDDLPF